MIAPAADDPCSTVTGSTSSVYVATRPRHSIICVSGAVYAMRRALWRPMPAALICDDLFVTIQVIFQGWRVAICERAFATDPREFSASNPSAERSGRSPASCTLRVDAGDPPAWRNAIWIDFVIHNSARVLLPYLGLVAAIGERGPRRRASRAPLFGGGAGLGCALAVLALIARPAIARQLGWALKLSSAPVIALSNALADAGARCTRLLRIRPTRAE